MLVAAAATIFGAAYPVVVPSTIDPAFDVTVADASVSDYTLTVMTWAAGIGLPVVLGYQAWTSGCSASGSPHEGQKWPFLPLGGGGRWGRSRASPG